MGWQDLLETYKTDKNAASNEVLRAKQVYETKKAAGDMEGAEAAHTWANQIRSSAGLDDNQYGSGVTIPETQNYIKPTTNTVSVQPKAEVPKQNIAQTPVQTPTKAPVSTDPQKYTSDNGGIWMKTPYGGMSAVSADAAEKFLSEGYQYATGADMATINGGQTNSKSQSLQNGNLTDINGLIAALTGSIKEQNKPLDYKQIAQEVTAMIPQTTQPTKLTWTEALDRAKQSLNPVYDERTKNVLKATDQDLIRRGFYGQLPGEVIRQETAGDEETARSTAITGMANNLVDKSASDANTATQLEMQKQNQQLNIILNAINQANSNGQSNIGNISSLLNYLTSQKDKETATQTAKDNAYTSATGYMPVNASDIPANSPLRAYKDDYQAESDRRKAINPNDPTIPQLEALRNAKILSYKDTNPELYEQLKNTITVSPGIETIAKQNVDWARDPNNPTVQEQQLNNTAKTIQNTINTLKLQNLPAELANELELQEASLQQALIKAQYAPDMAAAELSQIYTSINNMNADNTRQDASSGLDNEYKQAQIDALNAKNSGTEDDPTLSAINTFNSLTDTERKSWWEKYKGEIYSKTPKAYTYIKDIMEPKAGATGSDINWGG